MLAEIAVALAIIAAVGLLIVGLGTWDSAKGKPEHTGVVVGTVVQYSHTYCVVETQDGTYNVDYWRDWVQKRACDAHGGDIIRFYGPASDGITGRIIEVIPN